MEIVLADPVLELHDGNGTILVSNDNWQDNPASAAELAASGLALQHPNESGIFESLPPGAFTAILAGKNGRLVASAWSKFITCINRSVTVAGRIPNPGQNRARSATEACVARFSERRPTLNDPGSYRAMESALSNERCGGPTSASNHTLPKRTFRRTTAVAGLRRDIKFTVLKPPTPNQMHGRLLTLAILLLFHVSPAATPTSAGNGKIAFESSRNSNPDIYVMDADGSNTTRLTSHPDSDINPAWSPDGTKIAFVSARAGFGNDEIYVMNADGSNPTRLTNDSAGDYEPAWSPDGTKIAFVSSRDGNDEIYLMDANGSNPIRLTNNPTADYGPAWSPDGTKIAFASDRDGNHEIYVMDADGANPTNLTNDPADDADPTWSPDGARIAFESIREGNQDIYAMDADGSDQTRLTNDPSDDLGPAWSPDGTKIAFGSSRIGNHEIFVMDANGSNQLRLTFHSSFEGKADWQRLSGFPTPTPAPTGTPATTPTATPASTPTVPPSATPTPAPTRSILGPTHRTPGPTSTPGPTTTPGPTSTPTFSPTPTVPPTGTPTPPPTSSPTPTVPPTPTATPISTPLPAQALNISTRLRVETRE